MSWRKIRINFNLHQIYSSSWFKATYPKNICQSRFWVQSMFEAEFWNFDLGFFSYAKKTCKSLASFRNQSRNIYVSFVKGCLVS